MKFSKIYLLLIFTTQPFFVNAALGGFQQIAGSPFAAGNGAAYINYSPIASGNLFAGVPNYQANNISVYSVNQTTGAFTPVSGAPFASGSNPAEIAFSPLFFGDLLVTVCNQGDDTLSTYTVDQSTGEFWEILPRVATGSSPSSITYSPVVGGRLFAAVTNSGEDTISTYTVTPGTGQLWEILPRTATGTTPQEAAFSDVVGGVLYLIASNFGANTVTFYTVNQTTGVLTQLGVPLASGINPYGVEFSPEVQGNLFAAATNDNINDFINTSSISVYKLQGSGLFAEVPGSAFQAGIQPNDIEFSKYTTNQLPSITVSANQFALCPDTYAICSGSSIQLSAVVTGAPPYTVVWSDGFTQVIQGNLFAAATNFISNDISVYSVDQTTGFFTEVAGSPFATGINPDGIDFSPLLQGKLFSATANFGSADASVFQVNNISQATRVVSPTSTTSYSATVTDANDNTAPSNTITIRVANNCVFCN